MCATRPDTISRSAWRGEARNASIPKRAMSYRESTIAIISIAQHESPNWSGHIDFVCDQATAFWSVVRPSFDSSSSTPSSRSKTPGPFVGQSRRSDCSP